jgi:hypothetical protein
VVLAGGSFTVRAGERAARESVVEGKAAQAMERIDLTNGRIVLGVLPPLGGRVVLLKTTDGENLLDADPRFWSAPFPPPALETPFAPWNGRILWVGPQSGFWSQQDLRPGLKEAKAVWPPDPFNETGRFEVVERTATRIRLQGAVSPVTGLAFEHEYEITGERTVRMKDTATNGRATPVSWDLWPNTRVRPEGFPYVLLDPAVKPRLDGPKPGARDAGPCPDTLLRGWFSLPPGCQPTPPQQRLWTKAFLQPATGLIAFFHGRQLLLIRSALVPRERLHPEQAFVELYRAAGSQATVLELEMHGPYETIPPGARVSIEQTFEVRDYDGSPTAEAHVAHLDALGR